jgi:hypothetical protein
MKAIEIINLLLRNKISVRLDENSLLVDFPDGVLTKEFSKLIKENRGKLIQFFREQTSYNMKFSSELATIEKLDRSGQKGYQLSYSQQRLWLIDRLNGGSVEYNMPFIFNVEGDFKKDVAEESIREIIVRHEPLRTVFAEDVDGPFQIILDDFEFCVDYFDFSTSEKELQDSEVRNALDGEILKPFDLTSDLLVRVLYVRLSANSGVLL